GVSLDGSRLGRAFDASGHGLCRPDRRGLGSTSRDGEEVNRSDAMAHILLIEDDRATRHVLQQTLAHKGWLVSMASSVAEGIALLEGGLEPDGLLLDVTRPDGAGEKALMERVRTRNPGTRVVVVTGLQDPARLSEVTEMGPDVLLQRPIDPGSL